MLTAQDIKHLAHVSGTGSRCLIPPQIISTGVVKSGATNIQGCSKVKIDVLLGVSMGTAKVFVGTSDTVSTVYSQMTAITATTLSGLSVSNTTRSIIIDNSGNMRKFLGVKVSGAAGPNKMAVIAYGIHNKTLPPRNVASGAAATGYADLTLVTA